MKAKGQSKKAEARSVKAEARSPSAAARSPAHEPRSSKAEEPTPTVERPPSAHPARPPDAEADPDECAHRNHRIGRSKHDLPYLVKCTRNPTRPRASCTDRTLVPMTDAQINRHEMHKAVLGVLDTHADAWASVPLMQTHRDALADLVETVRKAARAQGRSSKGATKAKATLRDAVADQSWRLGQALLAWANATDRDDVAAAVLLSRTAFNDLRDAELADYSEIVVAEAREHLDGDDGLTALQGVPAAFVDGLDALDDEFAQALSTPREAIVARKGAGRAIATGVKKAQTLLAKRIDPTVAFLAPDQPRFAEAYRDARIIVDRGHGPTPSDAPDGEAA